MNITNFLKGGGTISQEYKTEKNDYVGNIKLYIFTGYYSVPKICMDAPDERKEWDIEQIDDAIYYFENKAFNKKNLRYKLNEVLCELNTKKEYVDLDDDNDYKKVYELRDKLINK